jgi:cation diffusion facilitator family transporter
MIKRRALTRYAWLSIGAALLTMGIKASGYLVTRSVGLLSDALESGVNLAAAFGALAALHIGAQPPDEEHAYGHQKVEYLSSGAEGGLITLAAIAIIITAVQRLLDPRSVERLGLGLGLSITASLVNLVVAMILIRVGKRERSIALEADGQHLLSDVWTSAGVLTGVGLVWITGWQILDPIVALLVGLLLTRTGFMLLRRSAYGLIDTALPEEELQKIHTILNEYESMGIHYHALRTRQAGSRSFVSFHIQVPGSWSIQKGHDLLEGIEADLRRTLPSATVFTHIEPIEDPRSFRDEQLDREPPDSTRA